MQTSGSEKFEVINLDPNVMRMDGGTQPRSHIDKELVRQYREALKNKAIFPPIVVFYDGENYWLADGFHRVTAFRKQRRTKIPAEVHQGTRRDAILYSVGANAQHGRQRSHSDTRRAAMTLLTDPEWASWSDREIARRCHLSHTTVAKYRAELSKEGRLPISEQILRGQVATENSGGDAPKGPQGTDSTVEARKFRSRHGSVGTLKIAKTAHSGGAKNAQKPTLPLSVAAMVKECALLIESGPKGVTIPPELAREISRVTGSAVLDENGHLQVHAPPGIKGLLNRGIGTDSESDREVFMATAWLGLEKTMQDTTKLREVFPAEEVAAAIPLRDRETVWHELAANAAFLLATLKAFSETYRPAGEIDPENQPASAEIFGRGRIAPSDDLARETAERQHQLEANESPSCGQKDPKSEK